MSNVGRIAAQAANSLTTPLNVEEVFSTYLYEGTGAAQTITNGIDLDGEGGLVWIKERGNSRNHHLVDTERGIGDGIRALRSNLTNAEYYQAGYDTYEVTSANSDGFSLGLNLTNETNRSGSDYVSWTFRKAPKFFDVVTYTGNGSTQTISHNLGSVPGTVIVKKTNSSANWIVYHRSLGNDKAVFLNLTSSQSSSTTYWNATTPTSSVFSVGANSNTNGNGDTFVAYLFAHNDDDGEFGPDGDADIIKCGSYTGSTSDQVIDLGFEPQWVMIKRYDGSDNWYVLDVMRGVTDQSSQELNPNLSAAESTDVSLDLLPQPNGFKVFANTNIGYNNDDYIYIAIRRGPMAVPEDADDVFAIDTGSGSIPPHDSGFPVDMGITTRPAETDINRISSRLTGTGFMQTESTAGEATSSSIQWDFMSGFWDLGLSSSYQSWMWRRAPNYFDVVAYTGTGVAKTVSHNLGVTPEMMWVKSRSGTTAWRVWHKALTTTQRLQLNDATAVASTLTSWNDTLPTDSVFSVGADTNTNNSGSTYIAYLFASLDGVSKVGSFTGNGTSQDIDCGFSSGARFVLLKRTDSSGTWFILDTERGIVSGNDAILRPNSTIAENNSYDIIDPLSSGFTINFVDAYNMNTSDATYIFYAIA